jgi:preprotein translocase subunit SecD
VRFHLQKNKFSLSLTPMQSKYRFWAIIIIFVAAVAAYFIWNTEQSKSDYKFKLGLDLSGGTHLVYKADTTQIASGDVADSMQALRDAIERRINIFGVSEPLVQVERESSLQAGSVEKLIVELPGVTDVNQAIKAIGATPVLEFKLLKASDYIQDKPEETLAKFQPTGLGGKQLKRATVQFNQTTNEPQVGIQFNEEGSELFAKITKENVNDILGIFLDGQLLQAPYIKEEIPNGEAVISGSFTPDVAKEVVRNLNYGALPVPIELLSTQTIGATLGERAVNASVKAGMYAFIVIALFLMLWYRGSGAVAVLALAIYTALNLTLFKLIPVTLTSAGIAGFILSIGMAVDANILIFERTKEELKRGRGKAEALKEGFHRAWTSIRDSNLSSIITAAILYYFASTPMIKGFALVFAIGVLVSMFSAITASRTILFALQSTENK